MKCGNCLVEDLSVEIMYKDKHSDKNLSIVSEHLKRRDIEFKRNDSILVMNETGAKEFFDFCLDHMKTENVFFRLKNQDWKPIKELEKIFEMEWIDQVIKNESLSCYFQPIVNREEKIYAYEILSRFKKENGSLIYPNIIFEAARIRGRLYALDRLCRLTAVRHAVQLDGKKAFINFIPTSIYSPEFCLQSTTRLATQLGVDPSQLVFEVVETEKVVDLEHLKNILAYYRDKGFRYALDDVGAGYSTIEVLEDITPHYMKLDMKFVQGVSENKYKQDIAKRFLDKSLEIGSTPLAEGVEFREDFDWLKQTGYELFQGYLFGKPSPRPKTIV
jgi:EAL domain-containing protein (putative c-di-GMP-specific phosphodiesterase class I)